MIIRAKFFVRVYTLQPKNILEKSIQAVTERYHECLVDEDAMREIQKEVVSRIEQYKGRARRPNPRMQTTGIDGKDFNLYICESCSIYFTRVKDVICKKECLTTAFF